MISVIVITRNRHKQLQQCLQALSLSTYKNFETIIVDQSDIFLNADNHLLTILPNIRYVPMRQTGKTKGTNRAIQIAQGDILSFIDDDNIVAKNWLKHIFRYFSTHPKQSVVFGKILPFQPKQHPGEISPACFLRKKSAIITSPYTVFYESVGLGSNMSIKNTCLRAIGAFKEWLGPGVYGFTGGEDGEYITRMLLHKIQLAYEPNITVYHNRWLTPHAYQSLFIRYAGGEIAYATYYFLQGHRFFGRIALDTFLKRLYVQYNRLQRHHISLSNLFFLLLITCKGFIIGCFYRCYEK